ncbi:MAG: methyltransferase type 12 [Flavobacteriales bacterium]|nr:MAG: methyltransferase type 12 [Flavobacteriales bacterium]
MKSEKEIEEFYDEFVEPQKAMKINLRHLLLFDKLIQLGLNTKSNVLEFGCGIGTVTKLITEIVKSGEIISTDLSPISIEVAKERTQKNNVTFLAQNITEFTSLDIKFDFILLFDILEHIPIELHKSVFDILSKQAMDNTIIFINIPNPVALEYEQKNNPEVLQIIDQPLYADKLIANAYKAGLVLDNFITYDIWRKSDYQMIFFKKKYMFKPETIKTKSKLDIKLMRLKHHLKNCSENFL